MIKSFHSHSTVQPDCALHVYAQARWQLKHNSIISAWFIANWSHSPFWSATTISIAVDILSSNPADFCLYSWCLWRVYVVWARVQLVQVQVQVKSTEMRPKNWKWHNICIMSYSQSEQVVGNKNTIECRKLTVC